MKEVTKKGEQHFFCMYVAGDREYDNYRNDSAGQLIYPHQLTHSQHPSLAGLDLLAGATQIQLQLHMFMRGKWGSLA